MEIVSFSAGHVKEAAEIERLCFSDPWSERGLMMLADGRGVAFACVEQGRLAAYAGMICVLDEGEIVNVATHPDFRRRGYARAALRRLIKYADDNGIVTLALEVRESNAPAVALYGSEGFFAAGKRKNFYSRPVEDAIIMIRQKKDTDAYTRN